MLFRLQPAGPPSAYRTYALKAPRATHFRQATCEEFNCQANAYGWSTTIDLSTELGQEQGRYIKFKSGRHFTVEELPGSLVRLTFPPGQQCFERHEVPLERDPILLVKDGDWRGNPTGYKFTHTNVDDWVDDFANNQIAVVERNERG